MSGSSPDCSAWIAVVLAAVMTHQRNVKAEEATDAHI